MTSLSEQNFGFDKDDLAVIGKEITFTVVIAGLQVSDIESVDWVLKSDAGTALITKTDDDGIALTNNVVTGALQAVVTIDGADTEEIAAGDYRHRLEYVTTGGADRESLRGYGRLTAPI